MWLKTFAQCCVSTVNRYPTLIFFFMSEWSYKEQRPLLFFITRVLVLTRRGGRCVCVCACVLCIFVCYLNYLNPTTIKAEICYWLPPLEASSLYLAASVRCAPENPSPRGLSGSLNKDHKLWILSTYRSRTKTYSTRLRPMRTFTLIKRLQHRSICVRERTLCCLEIHKGSNLCSRC